MATPTAKKTNQEMEKKNGHRKDYPSPKELATPTDLKSEEVKKIVGTINPLVADAFALFVKTKNFHWHVSGSHFRDYHVLLEEQAQSILGSIDPLAERVRRIGGLTIRSIGHIAQLQTIEDQNRDFVPPDEMIQELLEDNKQMAEQQREAIEICEDNRDTPTANLLQEMLDETERRIWFLHEVGIGGTNNQ